LGCDLFNCGLLDGVHWVVAVMGLSWNGPLDCRDAIDGIALDKNEREAWIERMARCMWNGKESRTTAEDMADNQVRGMR